MYETISYKIRSYINIILSAISTLYMQIELRVQL